MIAYRNERLERVEHSIISLPNHGESFLNITKNIFLLKYNSLLNWPPTNNYCTNLYPVKCNNFETELLFFIKMLHWLPQMWSVYTAFNNKNKTKKQTNKWKHPFLVELIPHKQLLHKFVPRKMYQFWNRITFFHENAPFGILTRAVHSDQMACDHILNIHLPFATEIFAN